MTVTVIDVAPLTSNEAALAGVLVPNGSFDFRQSLASLKMSGATDHADLLAEDMSWLERPVMLNGQPFLLHLADMSTSSLEPELRLILRANDAAQEPPDQAELMLAAEWANRRFFLDVDMEQVRQVLSINEYGEDLCNRFWPTRPTNLSNPWDGLIKTMISMRIYPGLATRLQEALMVSYGTSSYFGGKEYHFFPTAETLAHVPPEVLVAAKFSRQKANYLPGIARMIQSSPEKFDFERLRSVPGAEAVAILDELPGVGPWMAYYMTMRGLAHPDVFVDEEGLRKTLAVGMNQQPIRSHDEFLRLTEVYAPYRSFACYYSYMHLYS